MWGASVRRGIFGNAVALVQRVPPRGALEEARNTSSRILRSNPSLRMGTNDHAREEFLVVSVEEGAT